MSKTSVEALLNSKRAKEISLERFAAALRILSNEDLSYLSRLISGETPTQALDTTNEDS